MPVALEQFVKRLAVSGVLTPRELEIFVPSKAAPKDVQELAQQLVKSEHLTKFRAQGIYQDRVTSLCLGNDASLQESAKERPS